MAVRSCLVVVFFAFVLSGCATPSLNLQINAAEELNSGPEGGSFSVLVRFYQLTDPSLFQKASSDSLFRNDEDLLSATLVGKKELMVSPSMRTTLEIPKVDSSKYLGVVAFFRDASSGQQMMAKKVNSGKLPFSTQLQLVLVGNQLSLTYR